MKSTLTRRNFLKTAGVLGGGLVISFSVPFGCSRKGIDQENEINDTIFNAYLSVNQDNTVKVIIARVEMGQGVWTTLPMLIANELDCDWEKVTVEHAPPGVDYRHVNYGVQMTGSSSSTYSEFDRYRQAGATARALLIQAAASKWNVNPDLCQTENGFVLYKDEKISYGEIAEEAGKLPVPEKINLKDPKDWKVIGRSTKRLDGKVKINGQAKYSLDMYLPDVPVALVFHPPVFGAKVRSFDPAPAMGIKGVQSVIEIPSGVAVLAANFWSAKKGRDALEIDWELGEGQDISSNSQFDEYRELAKQKGIVTQEVGDIDSGFYGASQIWEMEYTVPYLAHAAMEPMNCLIQMNADSAEIWAGIQMPELDRDNAAKVLELDPSKVKVNTTFMGGAFGRRTTFDSDFVVEAAHIAKATRKSVKLVWTREDDMKAGYFRAAFLHRIKVGLSDNGNPIAYLHRVVGQSIHAQGTPFSAFMKDGIDGTSVEGARNSVYLRDAKHISVELHSPKLPVPVLWWRSVGHSHIGFVMESMIDELAHQAGKDPVNYRRGLLSGTRQLNALNLAAEKSGWGKNLAEERFQGVAVHESFRSSVAMVTEVSIEQGKVKIHKVVCAIDCGLAVNPDGVISQMEGGIIFGLSAALYGEITLDKGQVQQGNFHDYKMLRINEAPAIEVYIVESSEQMGGAGEPCIPPVAPSLTNALFSATGKRIRNLPIMNYDLS
jgi:isoquinoline 1-oxidoreductase beta subunit